MKKTITPTEFTGKLIAFEDIPQDKAIRWRTEPQPEAVEPLKPFTGVSHAASCLPAVPGLVERATKAGVAYGEVNGYNSLLHKFKS